MKQMDPERCVRPEDVIKHHPPPLNCFFSSHVWNQPHRGIDEYSRRWLILWQVHRFPVFGYTRHVAIFFVEKCFFFPQENGKEIMIKSGGLCLERNQLKKTWEQKSTTAGSSVRGNVVSEPPIETLHTLPSTIQEPSPFLKNIHAHRTPLLNFELTWFILNQSRD